MPSALPPLAAGSALWALAGWSAHPREIWDVPAFWGVWGGAILLAAVFGALRPGQVLRDTALLFAPILAVLLVTALLTGRGFGLLPLGLFAAVVLALPGYGVAHLAAWLFRS